MEIGTPSTNAGANFNLLIPTSIAWSKAGPTD